LRYPTRGKRMQENPNSPVVKCPVCGKLDVKAVYSQALVTAAAQEALLAYRCSDGHMFLPALEAGTQR
jgi:hypothetical protein